MNRKCKKGFTLLEIVISLGLMAIIIIPTGNMVLTSVKGNKAGENKQQASMLLQETVEYLKTAVDIEDGMTLPNGVKLTEVGLTEAEKATMDFKYKVESTEGNTNDYGVTINGVIEGKLKKTAITTPGNAVIDNLGRSDMDVILKTDLSTGKIYVTENAMTVGDAASKPVGQAPFDNSVTLGDAGHKHPDDSDVGVTTNGNGTIGINGNEFKTKQEYRSVLIVLKESDLAKLSGGKLDLSLILNGQKDNPLQIFLYVVDDNGNEVKGAKFEDYINVTVTKGNGIYTQEVLNKSDDDEDNSNWENNGANSISITEMYSVKLDAVKNNTKVDQVNVDLTK